MSVNLRMVDRFKVRGSGLTHQASSPLISHRKRFSRFYRFLGFNGCGAAHKNESAVEFYKIRYSRKLKAGMSEW